MKIGSYDISGENGMTKRSKALPAIDSINNEKEKISEKKVDFEDVSYGNISPDTLMMDGKNSVTERKRLSFEEWYKNLPEEKNDTMNYNLRRAYELAPQEQLDRFANDPNAHLTTVYENEEGDFEFMKSKNHPTIDKELEWYYSDDPGAVGFREGYYLDTTGDYYKYVRKNK